MVNEETKVVKALKDMVSKGNEKISKKEINSDLSDRYSKQNTIHEEQEQFTFNLDGKNESQKAKKDNIASKEGTFNIMAFLERKGLKVIDKRPVGGAL